MLHILTKRMPMRDRLFQIFQEIEEEIKKEKNAKPVVSETVVSENVHK